MFEYKFENGQLIVSAKIDTNKDGQPVAKLDLVIDLAEIPDEALAVIVKKKAAKA